MHIRQGDVLLVKVRRRSFKAAKPVPRDRGRIVLAYGEVTGHAHAIDAALAELFEERDGTLYLKVAGDGVSVRHEEHSAIAIPPGAYRVVRQREYAPEAVRHVSD